MRFDCPLSRTLARTAAAGLLLFALSVATPARVAAARPQQAEATQPAKPGDAHAAKPEARAGAAHRAEAGHEGQKEAEAEHHEAGWLPLIAKTFNFAVLVAILVYYLRTPLATYLASRITRVREDLVTAAATREAASKQLADIEAKLAALPAELDTLKKRGAEEIVAERGRIEQAAEAERQRLLEHTRREIDMALRIAKRELVEFGAGLAVSVASERIKSTITPSDQERLVDRYKAQLEGARQ
jgi:F-type H+-transporting ATPase subunit b